jgi:aspartate racemase
MKIAGIVGGIGPESTIEYYKHVVAMYRERVRDGSYPRMILNSIDLKQMVDFFQADRLSEVAEVLVSAVGVLERAGADFAVLAANTPHVVFPAVRERSRLPLISIVEATRDAAQALGLKRIGLLGTRFTMQGRFYPDVFTSAGITLVMPEAAEQAYVHEKYMGELLNGVLLDETRSGLLKIVERLKRGQHIEALILGGTELSLILRDPAEAGLPLLDTTRIHAQAIVERMLS